MKTKSNKQNKPTTITTQPSTGSAPELQSRSEQLSGNSNSQTATAPTSDQTINHALRPYVNFEERERNRQLSVEKVIAILKRWMPRQYELAEVVGKWIWITFPEQPVEHVRAELSQLGFHWNNTRKCWQHPCGETDGPVRHGPRGQQEPRQKYTTYFPADQIAA